MISKKKKTPEIMDLLPCTPMQEAMLFHHIAHPDSDLYLEQICVHLDGPLDIRILTSAWNRVIDWHPPLRTSYRWKKIKQPLQVVLKRFDIDIERFDLSSVAEHKRERALDDTLRRIRDIPMDLETVPLRVSVIQQHHGWWLVATYHHIMMDGWSNGLVLNQVLDCMRAPCTGETAPGNDSPTFKSYVRLLSSVDQAAQREYWQRYLLGMEETAQLPAAACGDGHDGETGRYAFSLDATVEESLLRAARENKITPAAILYSAWGLVLAAYGDADNVVFGATVSGRPAELPEAERIVGLMINTLPLKISLAENPAVCSLWHAVARDLEEREPFSYVSPADVNVDFDSVMVVENYPLSMESGEGAEGLRVMDVRFYERTHFRLTVLAGMREGIHFDLLYQTSAMDRVMVEDIGQALVRILGFMIQWPTEPVSKCELMTGEQKREILLRFNDTAREGVSQLLFTDLWENRVKREPDAVAVIGKKQDSRVAVTVGQLDERAGRLAGYLADKGCGAGTIVAVMMERTTDLLAAIVGILELGSAYLPIDPGTPVKRVEYMLRDSCARSVVTDQVFQEAMSSASHSQTGKPEATDAAYVIYTSGTTGNPKGVVIGHSALANFLAGIDDIIRFRSQDILLSLTTVSFDIFVLESLLPLSRGAAVCLGTREEQLEPGKAAGFMSDEGVSLLQITPSRLQAFMENKAFRRALRDLRVLMVGGEPFLAALREELGEYEGTVCIFNMYGPTETTVWSTVKRIGGEGLGDIGYPIANTGIFILNRHLAPQPLGAPGDLYIGGMGLATGYLNQPELTAESFLELESGFLGLESVYHRLYRTGDAAYWERDGSVTFLGRRDQQVKIRGFRVEPAEIECALRRHPLVREAVVLPRLGSDGGVDLWGYVTGEGDAVTDTLPDFLADLLPKYMFPAGFTKVEFIPLTANGKIDRRALAALGQSQHDADAVEDTCDTPLTPEEELVADCWRQVLGREQILLDKPFFDQGGNSLLLIRVHSRLLEAAHQDIPIGVLFRYPTVRTLAVYLRNGAEQMNVPDEAVAEPGVGPVAVVGMAARFPGAWNVAQFWENVCNGQEAVRRFDRRELLEAGATGEVIRDPSFVNAKGIMPGYDLFAAEFFGYSAREADMMDPQLRVLHELTWEALEDACIDPFNYQGRIGLFAAAMENTAWLSYFRGKASSHSQWLGAWSVSDRDFLATRVAFALNLRGPAVTVQTACSSSLVAVDEAVQALQSRRADVALAGGVSFTLEDQWGYPYEDGMVRSPQGQCRAFDRQASGTVGGNGGGIVVLKLLDDVNHRFNHVEAVILGSAVNNDGNAKMGYTAPSVAGQETVINQALRAAGIQPASIGYIEAHGTGTKLGDPVEIEGLKAAFGSVGKQRIGIGSVKSNIGHLDAAAGIAGLIKTVLMARDGKMPASLHVEQPNPAIGFEQTPFFVNTRLRDWTAADKLRLAAVSSFGIGGTNAHVIVQEAVRDTSEAINHRLDNPRFRLLVLSAQDETALGKRREQIGSLLHSDERATLADVSVTLQSGRRHFPVRWAGVAEDSAEAIALLQDSDNFRGGMSRLNGAAPGCAFMFPGQGAQYAGMATELYQGEPVFRENLDQCFEHLKQCSDVDFRLDRDEELRRTEVAQPLLVAVEYSLARLLMDWGVRPQVMMGHSVGEWTAACLAGVVTLDEALRVVAARGRLMQAQPAGVMMAVQWPQEEIRPLLAGMRAVSLAAVNTPGMCVVSGDPEEMERLTAQLDERGVVYRRLHTSHAFHSPMMEPVLKPFARELKNVNLRPPQIPFVSNVTGRLITARQATDADYWVRHVREPVLWAAGLDTIMNMAGPTLLAEVGPGRNLTTFALKHPANGGACPAVQLLKHPQDDIHPSRFFYKQVGKLWQHGVVFDWRAFNRYKDGHCVSLPTYPFQRQRYWPQELAGGNVKHSAVDHWLYRADWEAAPLAEVDGRQMDLSCHWLVCTGKQDEPLTQRLKDEGARVSRVDPGNRATVDALLEELRRTGAGPLKIVFLPSLNVGAETLSLERLDEDLKENFFNIVHVLQTLARLDLEDGARIWIVTVNGQPMDSLASGPALALPMEYPSLEIKWIDVQQETVDWDTVFRELSLETGEPHIYLREGRRLVPSYRRLAVDAGSQATPPLKRGGVYLLTGGLGALGRSVATYLMTHWDARIVLLSHAAIPAAEIRQRMLSVPGTSPEMRQRVRFLIDAEQQGRRLLCLTADVADPIAMKESLASVKRQFGVIDGVFHCAGQADGCLLPALTDDWAQRILAPKVHGLVTIDGLLAAEQLDFVAAFSSINTIVPTAGQTCYSSANAFMDAYCRFRNRQTNGRPMYLSLDFDAWSEAGMAVDTDLAMESLKHPLFFGRKLEAGAAVYLSSMHAGDCWLLAEHRIDDGCLLPGTAYLELALGAVIFHSGRASGWCLQDVYFHAPLKVADGGEAILRTELREENGGFAFTIRSQSAEHAEWATHASGTCHIEESRERGDYSLENWLEGMSPVELTEDGGIRYGRRWNSVKRVLAGEGRAVAFLELPSEYNQDLDTYYLHPALLDVATMFAGRCAVEAENDYVPFGYRKLSVFWKLASRMVAVARWQEPENQDEGMLSFDVSVLTPEGEAIVSIEGFTMRTVARAAPIENSDNEGLFIATPGDLDSLQFRQQPRLSPGAGEVEIEVVATGLNYKEVLMGLGVVPAPEDHTVSFGLECSGFVSRVGPGVTEFAVGDEVIGYGDSLFGRYRCLPVAQAAHRPVNVDCFRAAGIPLAFLTAYYGLVEYGGLKKGEQVLIHSASGGVGLAAVAIARFLEADIIATAGSEEKRDYLRSIGIDHVLDSRSNKFAPQVMEITGGRGVDVVLNSLAGEFIELGLSTLAPHGRFIELGLKDMVENRPLGMRVFQRGIRFMALQVSAGIPGLGDVLRRIVRHIEAGDFQPVMCRVFLQQEAAAAFRLMAGSRHMGKLVVARQPNRGRMDRDAGLTHEQGVEALVRGLRVANGNLINPLSRIVVTPRDILFGRGNAGGRETATIDFAVEKRTGHSRPDLATTFEAPGSDIEETLATVFQEFLGLERIGVLDNFFELGATSLDMIQICNRLKSQLNREVAVVKLFNYPTIRSLSGYLQETEQGDASPEGMTVSAEAVKKGKDRLKQRRQKRRGQ